MGEKIDTPLPRTPTVGFGVTVLDLDVAKTSRKMEIGRLEGFVAEWKLPSGRR